VRFVALVVEHELVPLMVEVSGDRPSDLQPALDAGVHRSVYINRVLADALDVDLSRS